MAEIETYRVGGDNLGYLIVSGGKCSLVDPGTDASRIIERVRSGGLGTEYIILTHHHRDHTASLQAVRKMLGGPVAASEYCSDRIGGAELIIKDGDMIEMNDTVFKFIHTPGHTPGSMCVLVNDMDLFTGDTLFIDDCGRCDLPGGDLIEMFSSLRRISKLPDEIRVRPGHDYGSRLWDTLGNQKRRNPCLVARSIEEFSRL